MDNEASWGVREANSKKVWRLWVSNGEAEWAYQAGFKKYDKWMTFFGWREV